jgi:thioester reductase-like protein
MSYEIERMLPRHYAIMEASLNGLSNVTIASHFDMSPTAIGQILLSPIVQSEMAKRRGQRVAQLDKAALDYVAQAKEEIEKSSLAAAKTLKVLMDSSDENIRLKSASKILDQVFATKDNKSSSGNLILNVDQLQLLQIALVESRKDNPVFAQMNSQSETDVMAPT